MHSIARVLLMGDDENEYARIRGMLFSLSHAKWSLEWASVCEGAVHEISCGCYDVCLLDVQPGNRSGLKLLRDLNGTGGTWPIILLAGKSDHEARREAMTSGAIDCLSREDLDAHQLERSIRFVLDRAHAEQELKRAREERRKAEAELERQKELFQTAVDRLPLMFCMYNPSGEAILINREFERLTGWTSKEVAMVDLMVACCPDPECRREVRSLIREASPGWRNLRIRTRYGSDLNSSWAVVRLPDGFQIGVGIDITEQNRTEEALRESERKLRVLSSRVLATHEEERRRIARELHDGVGSSLGAIKFSLGGILNRIEMGTPLCESIGAVVSMATSALEEVRRTMANLRPAILDDLGILATLRWFCRQFRTIYSTIGIGMEIGIEEKDVPEHLKIVLFRVVQEALHNVSKHSGAGHVLISLAKSQSSIKLTIRDDGAGFDRYRSTDRYGDDSGGMGISGMKERVELSGGIFSLESQPGKGTTIRAVWPCKDKGRL